MNWEQTPLVVMLVGVDFDQGYCEAQQEEKSIEKTQYFDESSS